MSMSEQRRKAGPTDGDDSDAEPRILGVEDIPGALSPSEAGAGAGAAADGGNAGLNDRLAAFRERRAAQGGGGATGGGGPGAARRQGIGRGQGMGAGRGGGGAGQGARAAGQGGARTNADEDPIAAGKRVLEQFNSRLANAGEDKRGMQYAIRTIGAGYDALEKELERLRGELARAHEAIRTVQRQGD
jgi:hypothetical protein